jgi:diguanylate cyclase (GGDEF)-like protein/PAS domain S-box-containing protein
MMNPLSQSSMILGPLFASVRDAVIVADSRSGSIVMWNPAAEVMFGYSESDAVGMLIEQIVPARLRLQHREGIRRYAETGRGMYINSREALELPALRRSGDEITIELTLSSFVSAAGDPLVVGIARDVTERKRLQDEVAHRTEELSQANAALKELAGTDTLTGLANRGRAMEILEKFVSLSKRYSRPLSLAVLDIDRFKRVNDRHGHVAGDEVLRRLGALLIDSFRGEDVVARWGGEEFLIGMFGMGKPDAVKRLNAVAERFRRDRFTSPDGQQFVVTFSAGVAEYPADADEVPALYLSADIALYQAKEGGRDRIIASE